MKQTHDGIATILRLEEEKYVEMLRKGGQVIKTMLANVEKTANTIDDELLFSLNDSHGIAPEMAISLAHQSGWTAMSLRTGFTAELAQRHARMARDAAKEIKKTELISSLPSLPLPKLCIMTTFISLNLMQVCYFASNSVTMACPMAQHTA
ncbi:MAG: hypothetical protein CM15mP3_11470 [Candidatus Poseidoniales archaeon]|nr:MAG: hypothetical protein CM15mP3_11470 [Candidatus Poseidoniales archaeon]